MKIQLPIGKDQLQIFNIRMIIFGTWGPLLISDFNDMVLLENPGGFAKVVTLTDKEIKYHFSPEVTTLSNSKRRISIEDFEPLRVSVYDSRFFFYSRGKAYQIRTWRHCPKRIDFTINSEKEIIFDNPQNLKIKRV